MTPATLPVVDTWIEEGPVYGRDDLTTVDTYAVARTADGRVWRHATFCAPGAYLGEDGWTVDYWATDRALVFAERVWQHGAIDSALWVDITATWGRNPYGDYAALDDAALAADERAGRFGW